MTDENPPIGQHFSQLYIERGAPQDDSARLRFSLAAYINDELFRYRDKITCAIHREQGIPVSWNAGYNFQRFLEEAELRDVLDLITTVWRVLARESLQKFPSKGPAREWHDFVEGALAKENMAYRLDEQCGVHYLVDEEFERNRLSALRCLGAPQYNGVRNAFEEAHSRLEESPPNTKAAVRSIIESVEILYKMMVGSQSLTTASIRQDFQPLIAQAYGGDNTALRVSNKLADGFRSWVEGAHFYRHGQPEEKVVAPPLGIAVHIVSMGASYLRWLVELHEIQ